MTGTALRHCIWVHKWSSLACTLFMLLLCLTGLPLIFNHEIDHWLHADLEPKTMPVGTPMASLDRVVETAQRAQPGKVVQSVAAEAGDDRLWFVTLGATATAQADLDTVVVDARTAEILGQPKFDEGFMYVMLKLHVDLFAGLPGTLFLGFMGLLLVVAIVSGVVLYAPFMRKLDFGTVRSGHSDGVARASPKNSRLKWLDLHNLLGIVTVTWVFVVGVTGVINTLGQPLFKIWQATEVMDMLAPYKNLSTPTKILPLQAPLNAAKALERSMKVTFVAFPGTQFSSPHHYSVFMTGNTPLTARLLKPVLVDAQTAQVTASRSMPWYMAALFVSQPLHFGDYGGLPMKIIWALLDVMTIIVLLSGLYLWVKRRKQVPGELHHPAELDAGLILGQERAQ
jgi:uncharacterized iron-regulated membrane protein